MKDASTKNGNYQVCSNCVMDTTDKKIKFNEEGVCDHCANFYKRNLNIWEKCLDGSRASNLHKITQKIIASRNDSLYDCLIGISGGPDSSYMLHYIVQELNLRPLVFHVDGGWNTQRAVNNINKLVNKLNLDLFVNVVDWEEMRALQVAFFRSGVSHLDTPQDHAFTSILYDYANKYNIKYIFNGQNLSTEAVMVPLDWMYYTTDVTQLRDIEERFMEIPLKSFTTSSAFNHRFLLRIKKGISIIKPLDCISYIKSEAQKVLQDTYGWESFDQKHYESVFTKFYEGYWLPTRFEIDTRKITLSSMILTGQITRKEALNKLEKPALTAEEIEILKDFMLRKLRISKNELDDYLNMPIKYFYDYKNDNYLYSFGARIYDFFNWGNGLKR